MRVKHAQVSVGRADAVAESHRKADNASHARSWLRMPDVRLAATGSKGQIVWITLREHNGCERAGLNRIAKGGSGAVRLQD